MGRYACLRLGSDANAPAADLTVSTGNRYSVAGAGGVYGYDAADRTITWTSGPFATATTNWIGVFVAAGQGAKDPTIVIRDRKDVAAGNKRDLQWCNHVR